MGMSFAGMVEWWQHMGIGCAGRGMGKAEQEMGLQPQVDSFRTCLTKRKHHGNRLYGEGNGKSITRNGIAAQVDSFRTCLTKRKH
jgi:hypothetical protein